MPFLDWRNHIEAKAVWEGFLWSPRLYQPLMTAFKFHFLDSANHYEDLGEHRQQYASLLTYAALGPTQDYTVDEFRGAISVLPQHGLEKIAMVLYQAGRSRISTRGLLEESYPPFLAKYLAKITRINDAAGFSFAHPTGDRIRK
ncbi:MULTISPECIES: hypothetical protein [Enterobacteriaceae]|uniref:hypothetical protein n=1 Tax=Enterobacteriaceae TaxID=543 RepID=UPI0012E22E94|nr:MULTISPECIES: hypothetical protein [Enterobacteriaceae]QGU14919.1 hypothetical protein GNG27_09695 [Leclercia sp. 119287]